MIFYYVMYIVCIVLGLFIGYFLVTRKYKVMQFDYNKLIIDNKELKNNYQDISNINQDNTLKVGMFEKDLATYIERNENSAKQLKEQKDYALDLEQKLQASNQVVTELKEHLTEERTKISEREKKLIDLKSQFEDQKKGLKDEFKNLSNEILKDKQELLKKENSSSITNLISPLKTQLESFQKRVNEVHTEQTKSNTQLFTQITSLNKMNENLKNEAENLANALKNDKKLLGNWGEIQVERLLEESGLIKGHEFKREDNFKNSDGDNRRPDFVIYLPDDKHIIIDSKVSLNDYVKSVNAKTNEEQRIHIKDLTKCIKNHIENLSSKDYTSLIGVNSPDFVFMFMPIETAYLAAFEADITLFDYAYKKKVAVVTPNTLLPILRTVSSLWNIEKQNRSTRQIAESASKVYDKLEVFSRKFLKIENSITQLSKNYTEAHKTLVGPRSLSNIVDNFKSLGVKVKKELPSNLSESLDVIEGE